MSFESHQRLRARLTRLGPIVLIGALVAWHAFHNWVWLQENVVLTGWDKARHLAQSAAYNNLLSPFTLRTLFDAFVSDSLRTPLAPMSAVVLYRLFGVSSDVAVMTNVIYLAVTLWATWRLGVLLHGRGLGALSVVLLALLPMFYAMSRYFYIEFPLTAMVTLTIYVVLASEGFQRRGTTLFFGICLGLGLLTKRTYPAFVFAPIGLIVLRSEALPTLWRRLRGGVHIDWKEAGLGLVGGLALAAVWTLPNWATVQRLALGAWLYPLWAGMVAITIYLLRRRPAPDTNMLSAVALGATMASLWYLANISFVRRMLLFGYGVDDPRGRTIGLRSLSTYTDYLGYLVSEHISLWISLILVTTALVLAFVLVRNGRLMSALRRLGTGWWAVILWVLGPYLVLTLSIYHEPRAITPVLPAIALLGGGVLVSLPWKKATVALTSLLLVGGLVQFYAVSFEPLQGLMQAASMQVPLLGEIPLLAWGGYLQRPDEGPTDHRYWIQPEILQRMEQDRVAQGWETVSMGLLANDRQLNFEHFAYLSLAQGLLPRLSVERLARAHGEEPVYPRLFRHDYLLVKPNNAAVDRDSQAVIDLILQDPPPLFQSAFELDKTYTMPDGESVYLFRRRERPPDGVAADLFPELATALNGMAREKDAVVVIPPRLASLAGQYLAPGLEVYALPGQTPAGELVTDLAAQHRRILAILGEWAPEALDDAGRRWLNEHAFRAWDAWFGPTQLVVYGTDLGVEPPAIQPVEVSLGDKVRLVGYAVQGDRSGDTGVVPITLLWQALGPIDKNYKVFVHLVDGQGQLAAQRDSEPAGGSRPATTWAPGEIVTDRVGLLLPAEPQPGEYQVLVGMYDPATMERLPVLGADQQVIGDALPLTMLHLPVGAQ